MKQGYDTTKTQKNGSLGTQYRRTGVRVEVWTGECSHAPPVALDAALINAKHQLHMSLTGTPPRLVLRVIETQIELLLEMSKPPVSR